MDVICAMEAQKESIGQAFCGCAQDFMCERHFNKHCAHALSNYIDVLSVIGRQNWEQWIMTPNGQSNKTDSKLNPGLNFTPHGQCNTITLSNLCILAKKQKPAPERKE